MEEQTAGIECPKCHSPMREAAAEGITADRCVACGGLWLDALEKDQLLEGGHAKAIDTGSQVDGRRTDAIKTIRCPRDGSDMIPMTDHRQPHVCFEGCTVCGGIFLDAGELRDLDELTIWERLRGLLP